MWRRGLSGWAHPTHNRHMSPSRLLSALAACALLISLAGCTSGTPEAPVGDGSAGEVNSLPIPGVAVGPEPDVTGLVQFDPNVPNGQNEAQGDASGSQARSAGRSIVRSASVELTVASVTSAADSASGIAEELGGSIPSQTFFSDAGGAQTGAQLTLRVPTDRLDEALSKLGELGDVRSENRSTDDVTEVHVDLEARVKSLGASVERLTQLMQGATTTSELIEAESALAQRQQELDGLKAQLESLEGQIDQADVWVSLQEQSALPGGPRGFWDAIVAGVSSIGAFFAGAYIALGFALPWILLVALLGLAVYLPLRARKRRARAAKVAGKGLSAEPTDSVAKPRDL